MQSLTDLRKAWWVYAGVAMPVAETVLVASGSSAIGFSSLRILSGFPHCSRSISQRDDDRIGDRSPQRIPEPGYRRGHWDGVGPRALFQRGECLFGIDRLFGPMLPRSSIQKFLQAGKT